MPTRPPQHRPPGWQPYKRVRTDSIDRSYGTAEWRRTSQYVIKRDGGICAMCGRAGANTCDHVIPKREGGSDHPSNLRSLCHSCHSRHTHSRRQDHEALA